MHAMFNAPQFPQQRLPPARCLTQFDGPSSEGGHEAVEPIAHRLFGLQHIHRANYRFQFVKPSGDFANHVPHFPQPLLG